MIAYKKSGGKEGTSFFVAVALKRQEGLGHKLHANELMLSESEPDQDKSFASTLPETEQVNTVDSEKAPSVGF